MQRPGGAGLGRQEAGRSGAERRRRALERAAHKQLHWIAAAIVAALAAAPSAPSAAASSAATCKPTRPDPAGPFESTGAPTPRRAKIGTGHVLLGQVLGAPGCKPVAGAIVELWQAGPRGYTRAGRGRVVTDRLGRFRFEGPVPASDDGFLPHIHVYVRARGYESLLSRYVVPSGERTGRLTLVLTSPL
jgi:protocatechuate 3,4-dioxygenase beta subunit